MTFAEDVIERLHKAVDDLSPEKQQMIDEIMDRHFGPEPAGEDRPAPAPVEASVAA